MIKKIQRVLINLNKISWQAPLRRRRPEQLLPKAGASVFVSLLVLCNALYSSAVREVSAGPSEKPPSSLRHRRHPRPSLPTEYDTAMTASLRAEQSAAAAAENRSPIKQSSRDIHQMSKNVQKCKNAGKNVGISIWMTYFWFCDVFWWLIFKKIEKI